MLPDTPGAELTGKQEAPSRPRNNAKPHKQELPPPVGTGRTPLLSNSVRGSQGCSAVSGSFQYAHLMVTRPQGASVGIEFPAPASQAPSRLNFATHPPNMPWLVFEKSLQSTPLLME